MKAISPMIAVVLLIAFTVAVGGILSVWLSTLSTTQTATVSSGTEKQIKCSASSLAVKEVRFNVTAPCAGCLISGKYVNVTIKYDSGTETLQPNFTVEVIGQGGRNTSTTTNTLEPGESAVASVNVSFANSTGGVTGGTVPELVRTRSWCRDTVSIIAECKLGQPCMKSSS